MTQKDKMLRMVLDDPKLRETYDYAPDDYESIYKNVFTRPSLPT